MYSFQVSIKPGYVAYFNVEVFVPKKEGQYIGDIEMETDYEVGGCSLNSVILLHEKFLQFDWLRTVVFQLNLKYVRVKITKRLRVVV